MRFFQFIKAALMGLCLVSQTIQTNGYSFKDPTSKSPSSGLSKINSNFTSRRNIHNTTPTQGSGMPVSKFKQSSPGAQNKGYNNLGGATGAKTVGGNNQAQDNGNNATQILQLLQTNPQMMKLFQSAMGSGNSQQKSNMLSTLLTLIGGSGAGGAAAPKSAPGPEMPGHCSAPKYNTVMNALKGIPIAKEKALQHNSVEKIHFVYYKKTEKTNFYGYKLVFKFVKMGKNSYVYADFSIPKIAGHHLNFSNYLITSNDRFLQTMVNETDFSPKNLIKCIDLKIMFNGGIGGQVQTSAFGANSAMGGMNQMTGSNTMMPAGMGMNNMMRGGMMGGGMMGGGMMGGGMAGNPMMRGGMAGGMMPQGNMMGMNPMGMMGQSPLGNSQGGGMGYKPPGQGTFLTGK